MGEPSPATLPRLGGGKPSPPGPLSRRRARGRSGGGFGCVEFGSEARENGFDVVLDLVVREAQNARSEARQLTVSHAIDVLAAIVESAVGLDGEPSARAEEVDDVAPHNALPREANAQCTPAKALPEESLSRSCKAAQAARKARFRSSRRPPDRTASTTSHDPLSTAPRPSCLPSETFSAPPPRPSAGEGGG